MVANVSPGVYWREHDLSFYVPQLASTQVGFVGLASKGPINKRTLITDIGQMVATFGNPSTSFPALFAGEEYLKNGRQLFFVRVESEATPATLATVTINDIAAVPVTWSAKDAGTYYNGIKIQTTHGNAKRRQADKTGDGTATVFTYTATDLGKPVIPGTVIVYTGATVGALTQNAADNSSGVIAGTGITGTVNYNTGAISVTFGTAPAATSIIRVVVQVAETFSVDIYKEVSGRRVTLEQYAYLTLTAGHEHYYQTVLGRSRIITVPTLAALPIQTTVTMAGGTNGSTGITSADYIGVETGTFATGLQLFASPDTIDINVIAVPGKSEPEIVFALVDMAVARQDCMALIDPPDYLDPQTVVDWADGAGTYSAFNAVNSSYAAIYYPWLVVYDKYETKANVRIPPSGFAARAFAKASQTGLEATAPAGVPIGQLHGVIGSGRELRRGERDFLYENRINPINDFIASGVIIWGQKTAQVLPSALDRVGTRRQLIEIEKAIATFAMAYVFKLHNETTWRQMTFTVQPYLDAMVARGAYYYAKFICDSTTNTPDRINNNELVANIFLKPTKYAEIITLNFVLLETGARVEEYIGLAF